MASIVQAHDCLADYVDTGRSLQTMDRLLGRFLLQAALFIFQPPPPPTTPHQHTLTMPLYYSYRYHMTSDLNTVAFGTGLLMSMQPLRKVMKTFFYGSGLAYLIATGRVLYELNISKRVGYRLHG